MVTTPLRERFTTTQTKLQATKAGVRVMRPQ